MEDKEYKPLHMFATQTDELKKLIAEHPDYPIIVEVDSEVVADDNYSSWYAPSLKYRVGELLDCRQTVNDERAYLDRDDFREDVSYYIFECDNDYESKYGEFSTEQFDKLVDDYVAKYDEYWKPVIIIYASV